jgi:lysozyme
MTPSENCTAIVKQFEGLRLEAYQDTGGIWTIGWGHTAGVRQGQKITEQEAEALLAADLAASAEFVSEIVTVKLTQNQFDALCDFDFNEGGGHLGTSTLLWDLNHGNYAGAAGQFCLWVYARDPTGKLVVLQGLANRRDAEHKLFMTPEAA